MNTTIKAIALAAVIALVAVTLVSEDSSAVEITDGGFEYSASGNSATVIGWEGDSSEITIPATVTDGNKTYNVTKIGTEAFIGSGITVVDFSKATNLTAIEGRAFYGLDIAEIALPATLTSLGDDAFSCNDAVKTVEIPAKLNSYNNSFANCSSLESITVAGGNTNFKASSGMLLNHDGDTILQCPAGMTVKNLPADITKIGKKAFQGSTIDKFTVTEKMTSIGEGAFADCESLTAFNMDSNSKNKNYTVNGGVLFMDSGKTLLQYPAGKTGTSIAIINLREKGKVRQIEKIIGKKFEYGEIPTARQICEKQLIKVIPGHNHHQQRIGDRQHQLPCLICARTPLYKRIKNNIRIKRNYHASKRSFFAPSKSESAGNIPKSDFAISTLSRVGGTSLATSFPFFVI